MQNDDGDFGNKEGVNPFIPSSTSQSIPSVPSSSIPNDTTNTVPPAGSIEQMPNSDDNARTLEQPMPTKRIEWSINNSLKRSGAWYAIGIIFILVLAAVSFVLQLLTGEWQFWSATGLATLIFISLIIVNRHPDNAVSYSLGYSGIRINDKNYDFQDFRAFGIINDGSDWTVSLIPVKRLLSSVDMRIPEDRGEAIVDFLGSRLPMENTTPSIVDRLLRILKL